MEKKNYLWIGIVVLVVAIVLIVAIKAASKNEEPEQMPTASNQVTETNNEIANTDNAVAPITNTAPTSQNEEVAAMPLAKEAVIEASGNTFSPNVIKGKTGEKIFLTFSAKDSKKHTFNFIDDKLSYILISFSKEEGDKSFTFPAPTAGTYTFYVDNKSNTGKLIVE